MIRVCIAAVAIMVAFAWLTTAAAEAARGPVASARITRDCLRAHGWAATLVDGGRTVNGQAPRKLAVYPYRPWFSVAFYGLAGQRPGYSEIRMKLNASEAKTATACRGR